MYTIHVWAEMNTKKLGVLLTEMVASWLAALIYLAILYPKVMLRWSIVVSTPLILSGLLPVPQAFTLRNLL